MKLLSLPTVILLSFNYAKYDNGNEFPLSLGVKRGRMRTNGEVNK